MSLATGLREYHRARRSGWRVLDAAWRARRTWPYTPADVRHAHNEISRVLALAKAADVGFPAVTTPVVSIVIPAFNNWSLTRRCLASIVVTSPLELLEVIVVDDASSDTTPREAESIAGLRMARNDVNLGFTESANRGARTARGALTLFLNNDTVVLPGCIAALVAAMSDPTVGAAGARLLYPSGRVQEAGVRLFSDATGNRRGDGRTPSDPALTDRCDVDYCSAAALMARSTLLQALGFFDETFAPAYYEDTDLCFRLRAHGLRVVVEPAASVVHWGGMSYGTERRRAMAGAHRRADQELNREKFVAKWSRELRARPDRRDAD